MKDSLLNLDFSHWQAVLLSLVPALLNLSIFIYVRLRFPTDKISKIFSLYLVALIVYQISDTFSRMSVTLETAMLWNCIFMLGILIMVPLGLHFTLLFTGKKKFVNSLAGQIFLYLPIPIFLVYMLLNKSEMNFIYSPFWGWISYGGGTNFHLFVGYWLGMQGTLTLFLLLLHAWRAPYKSAGRKQSLIIAIGYLIPTFQAIAFHVILPGLNNGVAIPLTSTFLTFFSVGIVFALKKYDLFSIADSLQTETVMETMTDVLIIASPNREILFTNKEGEQVLGLSNKDREYSLLQNLFADPKQYEDFNENLFSPALGGQKIHNFVTEFISKTGVKISVLISATPFKIDMGKSKVLLLIHNITDYIQTSEQLVLREEQLEEKKEELNSFFYRTTHDLKGPIASIIGLTRLAKKDNDIETAVMCIEKIEQSATRLNSILLDFIKIMQIKERVTDAKLINFQQLTDEIIQSIKYSTGQEDVDFKVLIEPGIIFHSDEKLIDSILYNLVANGVNYRNQNREKRPFVSVEIHNCDNGIIMKVADNGIGMKKEIQGKIFSLFFRGNEDTKGTGLGLYILKNALDKLNGQVALESEINQGSTFSIFFPDLHPVKASSNLNLECSVAS